MQKGAKNNPSIARKNKIHILSRLAYEYQILQVFYGKYLHTAVVLQKITSNYVVYS